jgi:hypothetical protein
VAYTQQQQLLLIDAPWLNRCSCRSADVYEFSTETLFFGRQDAMQRTTLLPLSDFIHSHRLNPAALTLAEVGCGTGRFHTFIKVRLGCRSYTISIFTICVTLDRDRYVSTCRGWWWMAWVRHLHRDCASDAAPCSASAAMAT